MIHKLKPLVPVIVGGLLLSLLSTVVWFAVNNNHQQFTFGRVIEVTPSSLQIADKDDRLTEILFDDQTTIEQRRQNMAATELSVGDFVQITGEQTEQGVIVAQSIRLLRAPKDARSYEEN